MRRGKPDANHQEITRFFESHGCSVLDIKSIINSCDIFVAKNGRTVAVEIKDGNKPPSQRRLTEGEIIFRDTWLGEWRLVEGTDDALAVIDFLNL